MAEAKMLKLGVEDRFLPNEASARIEKLLLQTEQVSHALAREGLKG